MQDYVTYGLKACLQNIRNCCMRLDAFDKLRARYDALAEALADVEGLAMEASEYRASMWEYCYTQRSASARAHSRAYSQALKLEVVDFDELVRRYQLRLGYGSKGELFEDLEDTQKLEVYNSIIVESGRGRQIRMLSGPTGLAGLIFVTVAGALIDLIFGAPRKVPPVAELNFHTAVMPDGMALAYSIAH
ncbi:hypothetical protein BAE44_0010675 [Dichanthelium oligosanthes]|uniref:Uncharacterized protein n=1 Tax=Dichanthelium oligosanthes TaxID=888268 RepID=A0A1E5VT54_9POAL|nr:hypothetical protein BAE44_0010675 [Dichanthelium oligosanthes]